MLRYLPFLILGLWLSISSLHAQQTEAAPFGMSPDEISAFLDRLGKLDASFKTAKTEMVDKAMSRVRSGMASESAAADLYLACYKIVHVDRKSIGDIGAAADDSWKKQQTDWLKQDGIAKALVIQLKWLALTIEAAQTPKEKGYSALIGKVREVSNEAMGLSVQYAPEGVPDRRPVASVGLRRDREMEEIQKQRDARRLQQEINQVLRQESMGSLFAQSYNLSNYMEGPKDWPSHPLDLAGIYTKILLPHYRATAPNQLATIWDEWINAEIGLKKRQLDATGYAAWGLSEGKSFQWSKHMDLLQSGVGGASSASELLKLFADNPAHPNLSNWKKDLDSIMKTITKEDA